MVSFVVGSVQFVQSPPSTVYYPPPGSPAAGKTVICATDTNANISWITNTGEPLSPTIYNISEVSDRNSTMHITAAFINSNRDVGFTLLTKRFQCEAGTVTTSLFKFQEGGNVYM